MNWKWWCIWFLGVILGIVSFYIDWRSGLIMFIGCWVDSLVRRYQRNITHKKSMEIIDGMIDELQQRKEKQ